MENKQKELITHAIIILSITAFLFMSLQLGITGHATSEITSKDSGIGLAICALGIIGLTLFKKTKSK